jgi:predicted kinase
MVSTGSPPVRLPNAALVAIGPPASGKSTVATKLVVGGLDASAVISTDAIRGQLCRLRPCACFHRQPGCPGGEACQCQNSRVFATVHQRAEARAREGLGFYVDGTNLSRSDRRKHIGRAHNHGLPAVALLSAPLSLAELETRNASRSRKVPNEELARLHAKYALITVAGLLEEGFDQVIVWDDNTTFEVFPAQTDGRGLSGPFVVIADVHGCYRTLRTLLDQLGFDECGNHPDGLIPVFVGDLHDKGGAVCAGPWGTGRPEDSGSVAVLRLVMDWVHRGRALVSDSNHGNKLVRAILRPDEVRIGPALAETLADIDAQPDAVELRSRIVQFLGRVPVSLTLRGGPTGEIIVAHAAMIRGFEGRNDRKAAQVCNYQREFAWQGQATVVVGHVTVAEPRRERAEPASDTPGLTPGEVLRIDTGAFKGNGLSAWLSATDTFITVPTAHGDLPHPERFRRNDARGRHQLMAA